MCIRDRFCSDLLNVEAEIVEGAAFVAVRETMQLRVGLALVPYRIKRVHPYGSGTIRPVLPVDPPQTYLGDALDTTKVVGEPLIISVPGQGPPPGHVTSVPVVVGRGKGLPAVEGALC